VDAQEIGQEKSQVVDELLFVIRGTVIGRFNVCASSSPTISIKGYRELVI
jgi:hypothetical protein